MKIKLIREDLGVAAAFDTEANAANIDHSKTPPVWRVGVVVEVDNRGCQILVGNGDAEPADDEAEAACGDWRQKRESVLESREMLARAIEPEDRDKYRRGEILGYDDDGNYIPGPNWKDVDEYTESDE